MNALAVCLPTAVLKRIHQVNDDLFALATHNAINPRCFRQDLFVHERRMHPAKDAKCLRHHLFRDLQSALGHIDRWGDGGAANNVRLQFGKLHAQLAFRHVVGHRVEKMDISIACLLERTGQIRHPRRRPRPRDFGATRTVIWVDQNNAHGLAP